MSQQSQEREDLLEQIAIDVLEHPDKFIIRDDTISESIRFFRLWRFPLFDAYQSWHLYKCQSAVSNEAVVLQTLVWNRKELKTQLQADVPVPLIHTAFVQVDDGSLLQHLDSLQKLRFSPFISDLSQQLVGSTTGLAVAGNAWTKMEWHDDGPPAWKELDLWCEQAIDMLTKANRLAKFNTVDLAVPDPVVQS